MNLFFLTTISILVISNHNSFRVLFDEIALVYYIWKYIYILALEMASPGNQHCANCIGTLLFPIGLVEENLQADRVAAIGIRGSSTYRFTCLVL